MCVFMDGWYSCRYYLVTKYLEFKQNLATVEAIRVFRRSTYETQAFLKTECYIALHIQFSNFKMHVRVKHLMPCLGRSIESNLVQATNVAINWNLSKKKWFSFKSHIIQNLWQCGRALCYPIASPFSPPLVPGLRTESRVFAPWVCQTAEHRRRLTHTSSSWAKQTKFFSLVFVWWWWYRLTLLIFQPNSNDVILNFIRCLVELKGDNYLHILAGF